MLPTWRRYSLLWAFGMADDVGMWIAAIETQAQKICISSVEDLELHQRQPVNELLLYPLIVFDAIGTFDKYVHIQEMDLHHGRLSAMPAPNDLHTPGAVKPEAHRDSSAHKGFRDQPG